MRILPAIIVCLLTANAALAQGQYQNLAVLFGSVARPPAPGDILSRYFQYDIATRTNPRVGRFVAQPGPFGQNTFEVQDGFGRYLGELDSFAQKYEIRDPWGHTLGWFDTWGAFQGEMRITDADGREIGLMRDIFGNGVQLLLLGGDECAALFAKLGVPLSGKLRELRARQRAERFEKLYASN